MEVNTIHLGFVYGLSTGDFDDPPAFQGNTPKRARRESLSEAAFADTLKGRNELLLQLQC